MPGSNMCFKCLGSGVEIVHTVEGYACHRPCSCLPKKLQRIADMLGPTVVAEVKTMQEEVIEVEEDTDPTQEFAAYIRKLPALDQVFREMKDEDVAKVISAYCALRGIKIRVDE